MIIKQKNEMTLNNTKKGIKEKIPISSKNLLMIKNINKINKKAKPDIINNNNKANITYQNNINSQQSNNITKEKKLIPSKISKDIGDNSNHVSKYLKTLKDADLVVCLNEEDTRYRFYSITDKGTYYLNKVKDKYE